MRKRIKSSKNNINLDKDVNSNEFNSLETLLKSMTVVPHTQQTPVSFQF